MAKKYAQAKKRNAGRSSKPVRRKDRSGKLWLLAVLLLAVFIASLAYLERKREQNHLIHSAEKTVKATPKKKLHPEQQVTAKLQKTTSNQPKFDFYTMLPDNNTTGSRKKSEAAQQDSNAKLTSTEQQRLTRMTPEPNANSAQAISYMLQLATFDDFAKADELKATLAMQGVEVKIRNFKKGEQTFYRAMVGPYASRRQAQRQQAVLQASQIKSEIVETK